MNKKCKKCGFEEFNGYSFSNKNTRKKMKYLIVEKGNLDINNAYAFKSKKALNEYIKDYSSFIEAVFKIEDIT